MIADRLDDMTDDQLAALSDEELETIASCAILDAAIMTNTRWADKHHDRVDKAYAECARRRRGIYQRAFNSAVRSQGHHSMVGEVRPDSA